LQQLLLSQRNIPPYLDILAALATSEGLEEEEEEEGLAVYSDDVDDGGAGLWNGKQTVLEDTTRCA